MIPRTTPRFPELPVTLAEHQITTSHVTAVRERIERVLGVPTTCAPYPGTDRWVVRFKAPADVDLDFLRPDVLPPR